MRTIHAKFANHLPAGQLLDYQLSSFKDHISFTASNQYFSLTKEISNTTPTAFPATVDPHDVLKTMSGYDLIHAADNIVKYYKLCEDR